MPANHKLQHASLTGRSVLGAAGVLGLADEVASAVTATTLRGEQEPRIHCSKRTGARHEYWVGRQRSNGNNKTRLRFTVEAKPVDGRTQLSTKISYFQTKQDTFLGFIPAGPKKLLGYEHYTRFMINLEDARRERDPGSQVELQERPA